MAHTRGNSILDALSLNPLPYPVLLILALISIFFGTSWYFSYESAVESAEEQFNWLLLVIPVFLLVIVRWLSSVENPESLFAMLPWDRRRPTYHRPSEGSSPWGVTVLIVVLLVLLHYQSIFLDSWSI